ncbi:MAG: NgoFVII family restriction endonuclease [Clostridia bacterium]|nr:NgoFVII family restriction endonuclease [Clostridia bacterium]
MLFYQNLDKIVFNRNRLFKCDELIVLSGYVGPTPVRQLSELPIKSTVIYGMYGCDGIQQSLHSALVAENEVLKNVDILYSTIPVHSKCYIWRNKGEVVHALIGSANFSTNGLTTPFKEVLAETSIDTFDPLNDYLRKVINETIPCTEAVVKSNKRSFRFGESVAGGLEQEYDKDVCAMPLYIIEKGEPIVPRQSGINWGMAKLSGSHVNINDAYIRIGADLLEKYPTMFPKKQVCPSDSSSVARIGHRHNDNIEILWDDGATMTGLLEGSIPKVVDGQKANYPKQISTTPKKSELGKYLRSRMGISEGKAISYADLVAYGRTTIDVSLQGDGIYYFDFSVDKNKSL